MKKISEEYANNVVKKHYEIWENINKSFSEKDKSLVWSSLNDGVHCLKNEINNKNSELDKTGLIAIALKNNGIIVNADKLLLITQYINNNSNVWM